MNDFLGRLVSKNLPAKGAEGAGGEGGLLPRLASRFEPEAASPGLSTGVPSAAFPAPRPSGLETPGEGASLEVGAPQAGASDGEPSEPLAAPGRPRHFSDAAGQYGQISPQTAAVDAGPQVAPVGPRSGLAASEIEAQTGAMGARSAQPAAPQMGSRMAPSQEPLAAPDKILHFQAESGTAPEWEPENPSHRRAAPPSGAPWQGFETGWQAHLERLVARLRPFPAPETAGKEAPEGAQTLSGATGPTGPGAPQGAPPERGEVEILPPALAAYRAGTLQPRLVPLPSLPARPANEAETTIQVSIGRIEVRAALPPAAPPGRKPREQKVMSLEEYLNRRSGGER